MEKVTNVLLVDDEEDFRQVMTYWLKSKGYTVIPASNGEDAVRMAKENPPDIIFLDINMPVMDGIEAFKQIRVFNKTVPVIFISAFLDDKRISEVRALGISGVFYKGIDFQEGLSLLEAALRTHKK
jgi:CheY-like chemotaxis protein